MIQTYIIFPAFYLRMESVARTFIEERKIKINQAEKNNIIKLLAEHLEIFVFNVCSLTNIIILFFDDNKLQENHFPVIQSYMNKSCGMSGMSGGTSMASDFYGYNHPQYQAGSINDTQDMLKVDFPANIARPPHTLTGGGRCNVMQKSGYIKSFVKDRLKTAISAKMMPHFLEVLDARLACLEKDLHTNSALSLKQLQKVFAMKKHFIFT